MNPEETEQSEELKGNLSQEGTLADNESINLGSKIVLSGFRDIDRGSMSIIKKIVGNYLKRYDGLSQTVESLNLHLKKVHETEGSRKFEIHGKLLDNGKVMTSEHTDRNLFFTLDKILSAIEQEITD